MGLIIDVQQRLSDSAYLWKNIRLEVNLCSFYPQFRNDKV